MLNTQRAQLLRDAADDCESEANTCLSAAEYVGPTKAARYRKCAAEGTARAAALRTWADELAPREENT